LSEKSGMMEYFCIFAAVLRGEIRSIQKARFRFIP
jgi:hypothetical protein